MCIDNIYIYLKNKPIPSPPPPHQTKLYKMYYDCSHCIVGGGCGIFEDKCALYMIKIGCVCVRIRTIPTMTGARSKVGHICE